MRRKSRAGMPTEGIFRLGSTRIGVCVTHLAEICEVTKLSPLAIPQPYVKGALRLRGALVPVIDLCALAGFGGSEHSDRFCAILIHRDRMIGVAVDEILGFASENETYRTRLGDDETSPYFAYGYLLEGHAVTVLDVSALFNVPGFPSISDQRMVKDTRFEQDTLTVLTISAGDAHFAIDAIRITGTVPRQEINQSEMLGGLCHGHVTYHGWKVPVVNICDALGLGRMTLSRTAEVVVLAMPGNRRLGFVVDSINRISTMSQAVFAPSSPLLPRRDLLDRVFQDEDGRQIHFVNSEALWRDPVLTELSQLSSATAQPERVVRDNKADESNVIHERERYLVFDAGRRFACKATEISRIAGVPAEIVPGARDSNLVGMCLIDDVTYPLIDLAKVLGSDRKAEARIAYVLLVGTSEQRVAFGVERVNALLTSEWRSTRGGDDSSAESDELVQLGAGESSHVLPIARLETLCASMMTEALDAVPSQEAGFG